MRNSTRAGKDQPMANDGPAESPHASPRHIQAVLDALKTSAPDAQGRLVLARTLLGSADEAALASRSTKELAAIVDHAMAFLQEKPIGAPRIAIRPLDGDHAVIEILNRDMPFLMDSIAAELHARGLAIDLVLHPLIKSER